MILADTSGLLAFFNRREPAHEAVSRVVDSSENPLVVSPFVVAELDDLAATRWGVDAELAILRELSGGAYLLSALGAADLAICSEIVERYRDQEIGVADASLVLLADRHSTSRILTLDRRHFEVLRSLRGGRFEILPERG